ncbi:TPA: glycoside hydrolase family 2 protein [Streptococcus equi subsp. zooepidemicus]|nr:glycoside hydrolase family 2 protein [Streptococcus equi subsp. zooepidemicus]HEL1176805.1 glycoside hydrolase family 2 protein [Streptococcus equi subsp. zooepidemicus]
MSVETITGSTDQSHGDIYQLHWIDKVGHCHAFSKGWRFLMADLQLAQEPFFDDSDWQQISLPHDFSINQPYTINGEAQSAYKLGGVGWYRKYFALDPKLADHKVYVTFDGAYMETQVYLNGHLIGEHVNGYQAFSYDLSAFVIPGQENLLAVRVEHQVPSSRWYSGSGLYREAFLTVLPKVHLDKDRLRLSLSQAALEADSQVLEIELGVSQQVSLGDYQLSLSLSEQLADTQQGQTVYESKPVALDLLEESGRLVMPISLRQIKLWSPAQPQLYQLDMLLYHKGAVLDRLTLETGFRQLHFDAECGFFLNGKAFKLQGVCLHHDQGSLGACAYEEAIARQLVLLKEMGANTVRVTHNPSARRLKDLANRLGLFLIEEAFDTWTYAKNGNSHDFSSHFHKTVGHQNAARLKGVTTAETTWAQYSIQAMVLSGLHDPSVLMWSIGNELLEGFSADVSHYPYVAKELCQWITELDQSRPITLGDNKLKDKHFHWAQETKALAEQVNQLQSVQGVIGLNYAKARDYDRLHRDNPTWLLYGSETASAINSRGVYHLKGGASQDHELTSYDQSTVDWGGLASEAWYDTITRDFVAGECVWTGFDYLGEPTPWNKIDSGAADQWPSPKQSYFGILDTAGFAKDSYYFYQSQWSKDKTTLHILPSWQEKDLQLDDQGMVEVVVYSNAASVRILFDDGHGGQIDYGIKALTRHETPAGHCYQLYEGDDAAESPHQNLYLTWKLPYRSGSLRAIAYDDKGQVITQTSGRSCVSSYQQPAQLFWSCFEPPKLLAEPSLLYLDLSLLDAHQTLVANANLLINIEVEGPGMCLALDNGDPRDHRPYTALSRRAYGGKLLAIIALDGRAGQLRITARAAGFVEASYQLTVSEAAVKEKLLAYQLDKYSFIINKTKRQLKAAPRPISQGSDDFAPAADYYVSCQSHCLSDRPVMMFSYATVFTEPLTFQPLTQRLIKGRDIFLPNWLQPKTAAGQLFTKAFPIDWQLTEAVFSEESRVSGQTLCFGEALELEAILKSDTKGLRINQELSLVAKKKRLFQSDTQLSYRYQYDTVQAIGAISLTGLKKPLSSLRLVLDYRSSTNAPSKQLILSLDQIEQPCHYIMLEEVVDVLSLDLTLEQPIRQAFDLARLQLGLWSMVEEA